MKKVLFFVLMPLMALLGMPLGNHVQAQMTTVEIGDGTHSGNILPFNTYYKYSFNQMIYYKSEIGNPGYIGAIAFDKVGNTDMDIQEVTIWLALTPDSVLTETSWVPQSAMKKVFHANNYIIPNTTGELLIPLDSAFYYDGSQNLAVIVARADDNYNSALQFKYTDLHCNSSLYRRHDSQSNVAQYPGEMGGALTLSRPNIKLYMNSTNSFCFPLGGVNVAGVSESTVTISWGAGTAVNGYEVAIIDEETAHGDITSAAPIETDGDSFTFNGLNPNTEYLVGVRKICVDGNYSDWVTTFARTTATPIALPFNCFFEYDEDADYWTLDNGTLDNRWIIGNNTSYGEDSYYSMYVSDDTTALKSNTYNNSKKTVIFAKTLLQFNEDGEYNIKYDWKSNGESSWDFMRAFLAPANFNNLLVSGENLPSGITYNSLPAGFIAVDGGEKLNQTPTWQTFQTVIDIPTAGNYYLVYMWRNDGSGGGNPPAAIDNVIVEQTLCPSCKRVEVSNITATSATITGYSNAGNNFKLYYRAYGEENYDTLDITSPFELTDLQPGTFYEGALRSVCGTDGVSFMVTEFQFGTECNAITLPWFYGAEDLFMKHESGNEEYPYCWENINGSSLSDYWKSTTVESQVRSGEKALFFSGTNITTRQHNDWLITPTISFTGNEEISFWAKTNSNNEGDGYHGRFTFYASNDNANGITDTANYDLLEITGAEVDANYIDFVGSEWRRIKVQLPNTLEGNHHLAMVIKGTNSYNLCIDDIYLYSVNSCAIPDSLKVISVDDNSALVSWVSDANSYTVYFGAPGFTMESASSVTSNTNSALITGLEPNTHYQFSVVASCEDGEESSMSYPYDFTTVCAPIPIESMPFYEDFTDNRSGANAPLDDCWTKGTNNNVKYPYVYESSYNNIDNCLYFMSNATVYSYAALPAFEEDINNLVLTCKVRRYETVSYVSDLVIGLMGNPTDVATFVAYDTLCPTHVGEWSNFQVSLANWDPADGNYIAFMMPKGQNGYAYLDNIKVESRAACDSPFDPVLNSVFATTAVVSWSDSIADSWVVYYGLPGFDRDTVSNPIYVNGEHTATITGLSPLSPYAFSVAADCGDGSYSLPCLEVAFTTTCAPISALPYVEDFESYGNGSGATISPCWTKHAIGTTTQFPYPTTSSAIHGNRGLYFNAYETSTSQYNCYAALPMFQEPVSNLKIKFNMKADLNSSSTTIYKSIAILGVMVNPNDISTFDTVAIYDMSDCADGTVHTYEYLFENYNGTGNYITILAANISREGYNVGDNMFYIDDVEVDLIPTCDRPTNMVATMGKTTADLTWEGNASSYEVFYSVNEDMSNPTTVTVNTNSVQLTGLTPYTYYYVNVQGICSETDRSEMMIDNLQIRTLMDCGEGYENFVDTIGHGVSTSNTYVLNGNGVYSPTRNWTIFTVEELADMDLVSTNNLIKSIYLDVDRAGSPISFRIYMGETNLNEFSSNITDTIPLSQMTLVYDGTTQFKSYGWNEIMLQTPFTYSDTANLVIAFERNETFSSPTEFRYHDVAKYRTAYTYAHGDRSYAYRQKGRGNIILNVCGDVPSCVRPRNIVKNNLTATTFDLSWTGSANSYQIVYGTELFNPEVTTPENVMTVTGNHAVLQNLTSNTPYYIYIRSECGGEYSIWSSLITITTPCFATELPYSEDFDSYIGASSALAGQEMDPCWTKGTNNSSTYPYICQDEFASTPNSMEFCGTTSYYSYAALPMFTEPISNTMMTFKLRKRNTSEGTLHVGVMTDPNDYTTFQRVATVQPTDNEKWENFEVSFADYTGTGSFIAFMMPDSIDSYANLDNIEVYAIPSCLAPIDVTVSNITDNSALVSWTDRESTPAGGYELEYGPQGFELGTGIRVTSTTNPTTLTDLQVSTNYEVYVRAICSETNEGRWSFAARFSTDCGLISLPRTFGFEDCEAGDAVPFPHCFTRFNDATSEYYQKYPYVNAAAGHAHSGAQYMYFSLGSYGQYPQHSAVVFPEIDTNEYPMNGNQMVFWGACGSTPAEAIVGIIENTSMLSTFVALDTILLTEHYTEYTVPFDTYVGSGSHPAIFVLRPEASIIIYIDDVTLEEIPSCPRVYDLTAIESTATTATVDWTDTIGSTQWIVDYHKAGETTLHSVSANVHPFTITGLTDATQYYFNVRPICASGDTSSGVRVEVPFWTTQVPATLPYNYDFEDVAEWNNWQTNSNCNINWYRGNALAGQGAYAMYISTDNGETYGSNWNQTVNAVAYRDIDFGTDTSSFTMTFKAHVGGTIDHNYDGVSVLLVDPSAEVESSNHNITTPWGPVNDIELITVHRDTLWNTYTVHFEHMAGVHRVVFYWFNQNTGADNPYIAQPGAIDNIVIKEQTCVRPYDLYASNIEENSATLNWSGSATNYEVSYRIAGDDPSTTIYQTTSTNILNISDLESSTEYVFWVRSICSATDTSDWTDGKHFKTICSRYLAADTIREDFTNVDATVYNSTEGVLPDCWEGYSNGTNGVLPHVIGSGSYLYCHGTKSLIMTSGTGIYGDTSIVRLPYTVEPVNQLKLSYWMCTEGESNGTLEVGYLTSPDIANSFITIKSIPASAATHNGGSTGHQPVGVGLYDTVYFENVPVEAEAIAFRWVKSSTYFSVCLDDIEVTAPVLCQQPMITNTTIDYDHVTITWNGTADQYQLLYKQINEPTWSDTITTMENSYTFTDLLPENKYQVKLRAICGGTDGNSKWTETEFTTDELPCYVPTNVTTTDIDYEEVTLNWEDESVSSKWVVNVFNGTTNILDTVESKPITITGLYSAMEYQVAVKSLCSNVISSDWSDTITFTTKDCPMVTDVAASNITTNSAVITWDSPEAIKWEVNYGMEGIGQGEGEFVEVTERTYTMTNLEEATSYDVYVRIYCTENTYGQWSEKIAFRTLEDTPEGIDGVDGNFKFAIYPNPTSGATTIKLNGVEGEVEISIVDMNGRLVMKEMMNCGSDCEKRMDVAGLAQGTYFVRVLGDDVNSVRKLIVR